MLRVLIVVVLLGTGGVFVWTFLRRLGRALRGLPKAPSFFEQREMSRLARSAPVLSSALRHREHILQTLGDRRDSLHLKDRVDAAVRRIFEQEKLRRRILEAVDGNAPPPENGLDFDQADAVEAHEALIDRLSTRAAALERANERAGQELSKLHLPLLDVSATESVLDDSHLAEALDELETSGDAVRRQLDAEVEVEQFLATRKQRALPPER